LVNGRKIKCLAVIDEFTRESLKIQVERSIASSNVLETILQLFLDRGIPEFIRSDNGSEFVAEKLRNFLKDIGVKTAYMTPGSPWGNGYIEGRF
jgi:transposase InsO family protein